MGIRFEKDTILNWVNEMGKFLRLVVDKWETGVKVDVLEIEKGYRDFFKQERITLLEKSAEEIIVFASSLEKEQIRPLAQLLMYDGFIREDKAMLQKAKALFEYHMHSSGSFSFEDYGLLARIDKALK